MSSKKGLYKKLNTSVSAQNLEAKDKFENADLVMAIAKVKDQRLQDVTALQTQQTDRAESTSNEVQDEHHPDLASGSAQQEYKVITVPIEKVKDHPRNARNVYDPARIDEMATSIARDGQRVPAIVMPDPDAPDSYLLIEGRYRKRALTSLGRDTMLVSVIEPLSDLEAYRLSLLLNEERNDQTALDNAISWKNMLSDGVYKSQEHIAEHLNIKQGTVSKTLAILDLPPGVISVIKTRPNNFGVRVAQELRQLAKVLPEKTIESIAEQVKEEKLSVRDLEKMRERKEREPVSRERSRAYPLHWGSVELGSVKEFDDGRLKIDLTNAPELLRTKVIDAVKKVLSETPSADA